MGLSHEPAGPVSITLCPCRLHPRALWKHPLDTTQFTHLNCVIRCFGYSRRVVQPSPPSDFRAFHSPSTSPIPVTSSSCFPPHHLSLLSLSIDLPVLEISHKWDHTERDWLSSLGIMLSRLTHKQASVCRLFLCGNIFHCSDMWHFVYPFISWWVGSTFWLLGVMLLRTFMYQFLCGLVFSFLLGIPRSGIIRSYGNCLTI